MISEKKRKKIAKIFIILASLALILTSLMPFILSFR